MPSDPLLTAAEIAPLFRVTPPTIYRWAEDGTIPSVKVGGIVRFRRSDIDALLAPVRTSAASESEAS